MINQFRSGQTYFTRSVGDHDCIFSIQVAKRTAKTLVTSEGKRLRIGISPYGEEFVMPMGRYSMAPIITPEHIGSGAAQ